MLTDGECLQADDWRALWFPGVGSFTADSLSACVLLLQNLCFTKKIRYESRKQLAQARPRVKGQFVRMPSGAAEPSEADVILEAAEEPAPMAVPGTAAVGMQLVVAAAAGRGGGKNGLLRPMADVEEVRLRRNSCQCPVLTHNVALLVTSGAEPRHTSNDTHISLADILGLHDDAVAAAHMCMQ